MFNLPTAFITPKFAAVLSSRLFTIPFMGRDHLNASALFEMLIKAIAIVSFVTNQSLGSLNNNAALNGSFDQLYFVGRSTFHVSGDRKTRSVCNCHDLGGFYALCLADTKTPFFAGTKVPSINASRMSIQPRL